MQIKIDNKTNMRVTTKENADGTVTILITEKNETPLGSVKPGCTIRIGGREYVVLGHGTDTTAVITKKLVKSMKFGSNSDYETSDIRRYLNGEFYRELRNAVGDKNIIEHKVDLTADDGTNRGAFCRDKASLLTTDLYRRYRAFLPKMGESWWTATPVSKEKEYVCYVCYVGSNGALVWNGSFWSFGVRPFCILNSSISDFEVVGS